MWIFVSHFMIWPILKSWFIIEVAYPLTLLVCLGVWWLATNIATPAARAGVAAGRTIPTDRRPLRPGDPPV